MKKLFTALAALLTIGMLLPGVAIAAPMETKLIIESYRLDKQAVLIGEDCTLTFVLKNTNEIQYAQNITVTVHSTDGLLPIGKNMLYLQTLKQGSSIECVFPLRSAQNAAAGIHSLDVQIEYEDNKGMPITVQTTLPIEIVTSVQTPQSVRLRTDAPECIPVNTGEPVVVKVDVHNLGKGMLYNLSASAMGKHLDMVKDVYEGNLESGQSKTLEVILRFDASVAEDLNISDAWKNVKPGDPDPVVKYPAELLLTYEDASGKEYTQRIAFAAAATIPKPEEPVYGVLDRQTTYAPAPDITGWIMAGITLVVAAGAILLIVLKAHKRGDRR